MNQETGHKKLIIFLIIILLLIVGIGLFISWLKPSQTTPDEVETPTGFSPFDQRTTYQEPAEVPVTYAPETPYVERPPATVPAVVPEEPARTETRIYTEPPQDDFIVQTDNTIYVQPRPQKTAPVVYQAEPEPVIVQNTYYTPPARYTPAVPAPRATTTQTTENSADGGLDIVELDKQIFGYVSGLGWTQLLGDTGQQIFDFLYGITPQGSTNATLGKLVGIGGGGGGGGGMGGFGSFGGGGGASLNFGGRVSRVTYCTCSASLMLDINDVRGQMISLIYQPGATILYSNYNIYGTGQNVLGNYNSGGSCMVYHGEDCTAEGSPSGTMSQIGTSME